MRPTVVESADIGSVSRVGLAIFLDLDLAASEELAIGIARRSRKIVRHINQDMLLTLRERVVHDTSMARRRQLNSNTTLQLRLEVSHLRRIFTNLSPVNIAASPKGTQPKSHSWLTISQIIKHINRRINSSQRHLRNQPILRRPTGTTFVHHTNTRNIPIRSPPPIQDSRIPIRRRRVNTHFSNAERTHAANKDITAAETRASFRSFRADKRVYILRHVL